MEFILAVMFFHPDEGVFSMPQYYPVQVPSMEVCVEAKETATYFFENDSGLPENISFEVYCSHRDDFEEVSAEVSSRLENR